MGYYSNYLIKSIIRRIVNILINKHTLKILLFVLIFGLIFFKVCSNTTFAYEYNDQTITSTEFDVDVYNTLFDSYNNRVNRALNALSLFTEEYLDDDLFFNPAMELLGQPYSQYYITVSGNHFYLYIWDTRSQGASATSDLTYYDMDTFGNITSSLPCPFYDITIRDGYQIYFNSDSLLAMGRFGVGVNNSTWNIDMPRWLYGYRHSQIDTYLKKFDFPYLESFDNSVNSFNDGVKEIIDNQNQTTQDIIDNQNKNTNTIMNTITNTDITEDDFEGFVDTSVSDNILNNPNYSESENLLSVVWNNFISSINPRQRILNYSVNFTLPFVNSDFTLNSDIIYKHIKDTALYVLVQAYWVFIFGWHIINLTIRIISSFASGEVLENGGIARFRRMLKNKFNEISPFVM